MYLHFNILAVESGANDKVSAVAKPVDKLNSASLPKLSPLPRIADALQKLLQVLAGDRRPFNRLRFAIENDDWRPADVLLQRVRSVGVNKMKEIIHGIHELNPV